MSEIIKNASDRKQALKEIITSIKSGDDVPAAKKQFSKLIRTISPEEIADIEQTLISEGMPVEHVRELCDLHVETFQQALKQNSSGKPLPGHPVDTYKKENREAKKVLRSVRRSLKRLIRGTDDGSFSRSFESLRLILIHYQRKENQLFPYLERVGFTGPSNVMWAKHDEIRELFKSAQKAYVEDEKSSLGRQCSELINRIRRMIFMEERILFPAALRKLPEEVWSEIRRGEGEIGYAWIAPGNLWDPNVVKSGGASPPASASTENLDRKSSDTGEIDLSVGRLDPAQIDMMLKSLPIDVTFVDEGDTVRYYSDSSERIFPRSPGIIGRAVQNCHPPKSVHVVEEILEAFKKREKDTAEFWLEHEGRFVHIRYVALYNAKGEYRGVVEVSQDVTEIRKLEGSRTLLDW